MSLSTPCSLLFSLDISQKRSIVRGEGKIRGAHFITATAKLSILIKKKKKTTLRNSQLASVRLNLKTKTGDGSILQYFSGKIRLKFETIKISWKWVFYSKFLEKLSKETYICLNSWFPDSILLLKMNFNFRLSNCERVFWLELIISFCMVCLDRSKMSLMI